MAVRQWGPQQSRDSVFAAPEWESVNNRVFDVKRYGAVGDGTTDDAAAILAAHTACMAAGGGTLFFPSTTGSYRISSTLTQIVSAPLVMDLNGQKLSIVAGTSWTIRPPIITPTKTFGSTVAFDSTTVTLASATGVQRGDIFDAFEAVDAGGGANRRQTYCVRSVSGNVLTLTHKGRMNFSTSALLTHYRPAGQFTMKNGTLHFATTPTFAQQMLQLSGLNQPQIENVMLSSDQVWVSGLPNGFGILVAACVAPSFTDIKCDSLAYGVVGGGISVAVTNITAKNTRHPTVPINWCNGFSVTGVRTSDCYQSIDSHQAFDVHYVDVIAARDEGMPNLRCVGGSISNAQVYTDATDSFEGPFYHYYSLTDLTWYNDAVLTLRDMTIVSPNRTKSTVGAVYGHVVCENVIANGGPVTEIPSFNNTVRSLRINNCRNLDGTSWPRKIARKETRVTGNPNLPAYLDSSIYHIDPHLVLVDHREGVLKAYGLVFQNIATDPIATSIRIHTNVFGSSDYPEYIYGQIRLKAAVRHGNAGLFDILVHNYDIFQRAIATSSFAMPTTPSFVSALTGVANESLAMTVSNVTAAGFTQLGGTYPDTYVQFDLAISSGRTSPRYTLWYELDLVRSGS